MNCKFLKQSLLAALVCASVLGGRVSATPITVPDFSFENYTNALGDGLADGATTPAPLVGPSWSAAGNGGVFLVNPTNDLFAGTAGAPGTLPPTGDGTNYLNIGLGKTGYCWQTIGTVQSNTIYTLTVAVGNTLNGDGGSGIIGLVNGLNPFGTLLGSAPVSGASVTPGSFADSTFVLATGQHPSGPLTILLQGTSGTGNELIFDNVRLDATAAPLKATALALTASPDTNVYVGTVVTLSEDPSGALPFHYQWQTDNGTGGAAFSNVSGATNSSFVIDTTSFTATPVEYQIIVTNSLGSSTSAPVMLTASEGAPVIVADTLPASGSDVVGGQVTFSAVFDGTRPLTYQWQFQDTNGDPAINIPGATNATLTVNNLQLTDSGIYNLVASNVLGVTPSTPTVFFVNPLPVASNNLIVAYANQTGLGGNTRFTPSWVISTNSLIAKAAPSSVGPGNFSRDASGTVSVLTDGKFGQLFPAGNGSLDVVTCGTVGGGAGTTITYNLPASPTGYDVTNVVVYGGWSDAGRDQQRYQVLYSTVASPTNFNILGIVNFNPPNPNGVQSATRASIIPATAAPLAKNVAAIKFDFTPLDQSVENGYAGYSEVGVSGVPSAAAPVLATNTLPVTASDVTGSTIIFRAAFGTNTPLSLIWTKDTGTGPVPITGATNSTLILTNLQLSDGATPGYSLQASNASGVVSSAASSLVVNPLPSPDGNGVIVAPANQTGNGSTFTPTWIIPAGSLIIGQAPSSVGSGVFVNEGCGGLPVLTDGSFGAVGSAINTTLASCGQSAGQSVTYTLNGPASGFDITNIVTYGGWSDGGRDEQAYTLSYSTVLAPSTFIPLTTVVFNPSLPGSVPSADRVTLTTASPGPLATNVARVKFDFTSPGVENGWGGMSEISLYGVASAPLPLAPFVTSDTIPVTASDVVGSQVIFKAAFNGTAPITYQWMVDNGSGPVPISGATTPTLTLNNLQVSDSATPGYSLQASNSIGVTSSSASSLVVNPVPAPNGNGVIASPANQTGSGTFSPTWVLKPGSLIAGFAPTSVGTGSFTLEGASGTPVLTDGVFGTVGGGNATLATCGSGSGGRFIIYTLTGSATGYNLANIISYGGWADGGRDQQAFTASYSTVANPTTFIPIAAVNYNPVLPGSVPSADRVTLSSSTASPIASNVGAVKFDFTNPAGENGYSGYAEFDVYGVVAGPAAPVTNPPRVQNGNLILTGSGGSAGGSYTILTSTNLSTLMINWTTNTTGVFSGSGTFSNSIPIVPTDSKHYYRIRTP